MNDDYLWDGTGEPDPEIQQLEQMLRPAAYQPLPLAIPATVYRPGKRSWIPSLAIAATIALMVAGVGLWMVRENKRINESSVANTPTTANEQTLKAISSPEVKPSEQIGGATIPAPVVTADQSQSRRQTRFRPSRSTRSPLARRPSHDLKNSELSTEEIAEARQAKEQLLLALRLASSKLNIAQKKAQSYPANLIRNQHKVG